jgi:hypothetical protein
MKQAVEPCFLGRQMGLLEVFTVSFTLIAPNRTTSGPQVRFAESVSAPTRVLCTMTVQLRVYTSPAMLFVGGLFHTALFEVFDWLFESRCNTVYRE